MVYFNRNIQLYTTILGCKIRLFEAQNCFNTTNYSNHNNLKEDKSGEKDMKVVFIQDVSSKGKRGDIKEVTDGYAKNFLIPRGLALPATPSAIKVAETRHEDIMRIKAKRQKELTELAHIIEGKEVYFKAKVGVKDKIHGSITAANIAEELSKIINIEIDKKKIALHEPLRHLGTHEVAISLLKGLETKIKVIIENRKGA